MCLLGGICTSLTLFNNVNGELTGKNHALSDQQKIMFCRSIMTPEENKTQYTTNNIKISVGTVVVLARREIP